MSRRIASVALLIIIIATLIKAQNWPQTQVSIGDDTFTVSIAKTQKEHARGLMGVSKLPTSNGMLFEFEENQPRSFWMKNTLIPLDIIFIDENKKIILIHQNVQPCKTLTCPNYTSNNLPAKYVLEINGNQSSLKNIKVGDQITIH